MSENKNIERAVSILHCVIVLMSFMFIAVMLLFQCVMYLSLLC